MDANLPIQNFSCPSVRVIPKTLPDVNHFKTMYQITAESDALVSKKKGITDLLFEIDLLLPQKIMTSTDISFIKKYSGIHYCNSDPSNFEINNFLDTHTLQEFQYEGDTKLKFFITSMTQLLKTQQTTLENLKTEVLSFLAEIIQKSSITRRTKKISH